MHGRDIYVTVLDELAAPYNGISNRNSFDKAIRETLTKEECAIWLMFPPHTQTPVTKESVKEKANLDYFDVAFDHLIELSFLTQWHQENGVNYYVRNYLFQIMMAHNVGFEQSQLAIALSDWFYIMRDGADSKVELESPEYRVIPYEQVLTGRSEIGEIPMNLQIPDRREVVTYDYVSEMVKSARLIIRQDCFCRKSKDWTGTRKCDHPIDVCLLFNTLAERTLAMGIGKVISADEALELVRECRERGLIQQISNSKEPSILCNCCSCCCGIITAYKRHEYIGGKPSRYIVDYHPENCAGCGECAKLCPVSALTLRDGKLAVDKTSCIGCGLCASKCSKAGLSLKLRENADAYLPDREKMELFFL